VTLRERCHRKQNASSTSRFIEPSQDEAAGLSADS
jgi:hypothetical protein